MDAETGEVDWNKPPVNARTGGLASSTNPKTWSSSAEALTVYQKGGYDSVGFVLNKEKNDTTDGLVGVDLDHCVDDAGAVEEWAARIVRHLNTYTELSPSRQGLRLFLHGRLPARGRKKNCYENYETGRYVTVTGDHVRGTPLTIESRQAELEAVHREVFGEQKKTKGETPRGGGVPSDLDDAELVRRASEAKNGAKFRALWGGDWSRYKSRSEADLALCGLLAFWAGPDADRVDRLYRQSGLFRSKWNREDYRRRTLDLALQREEYYSPQRHVRQAHRYDMITFVLELGR